MTWADPGYFTLASVPLLPSLYCNSQHNRFALCTLVVPFYSLPIFLSEMFVCLSLLKAGLRVCSGEQRPFSL